LGFGKGAWQARKARAYTSGLGAEPPAGSRAEPLVGSQGGGLAETLFAFERSMEAANSPIFLKFGNAENHRYLRCFSKKNKV